MTTSDDNKIRCPECYSQGYATEPDGGVSCTSCDCRYYPSFPAGEDTSETPSESPGSTPRHAANMLLMASCDCLTKSPDAKFHEPTCRYRLTVQLLESYDALERRCRSLEAELGTAYRGYSALIEILEKEDVADDDVTMALTICGNVLERKIALAQGSGGGGQ